MSLTLSLAPGEINLVRNPMEVKLTTNNYVVTPGVKASQYIEFTAGEATPGVPLTITFGGVTVTLLAQNTPVTTDGLHYRTKSGLETLHEWIEALAIYVNGNFTIAEKFTVYAHPTDDKLYYDAIEAGTEGDITFDAICGTGTATVVTAGVDEVLRENFRVFLWVYIFGYTPTDTPETIKVEMEMVSNTVFRARINELLLSYLKYEFPGFDAGNLVALNTPVNYFKLKYYEAFGVPLVPQFLYTSEWYSVLLGGLHAIDYAGNTFLSDYVAPNFKWLTMQKRNKKVLKIQKEWLAFLKTVDAAYSHYSLKVDIYYTDANPDETQYVYDCELIAEDDDGREYSNMIYVETGFNSLVDPIAASGEVEKYKVTLVDFTTHDILSETFTYYIEEARHGYNRQFLFGNSLGWWDTLRTTGEREMSLDVTGEVLKKYLNADYAITEGAYGMSRADGKVMMTQNTGWVTKNEIDYLVELFLSSEAYEIINSTLIPIVFTKKEIKMKGDKDKLFALEFEYMYAYDHQAKLGGITT